MRLLAYQWQPGHLLVGDLFPTCFTFTPQKIVRLIIHKSMIHFKWFDSISVHDIAPSGPVDLTGTLSNNNSVFLTWKTPSTPNGIIVGYQIVYSGHNASQVKN